MHNLSGLARAAAIASQPEARVSELRQESGRPIIGYLCCFAPPEIISAAGAIPYRITGRPGEPTAEADAYLEPYGCSYVRNVFTQALKGRLDFLDGLVISHSCDLVQRLYGIWTYYHPFPYSRLFNVPHQVTPWAERFFKRELGFFKESLEQFTGQAVTAEKLREEIDLANRNRALIRELYQLRLKNPPLIKGSEMLSLLLAGGWLPAEEFNTLLNEALEEVEARSPEGTPRPRILVWGSLLDNIAFYRMIEEAGGEVAADDTCIGFRLFEKDIPATGDPDEGLKEHYFVNFQCPRTDRGPGTGRFDYLLERAREYNVDGVISYIISFCDPHKFDYPDLRDYLKEADFPMLLIDDNYSFTPAGTIQTRLQAFIELLAR
ncbi:MAG: 2-hydroxyacyl-CoA dehydratase family protein [Dethiobacteria bacterium]|jgi:bcr-type benzoyl-CoA reductase subunit C|nr:2-hydroxyacyl-CoA dehydratase family protein [Bacillota bacterium]NMD33618.1 2-hydroxyacyl-CoA dehydratase [Bacillota bacterium]HOB28523.1 2-hydroxyacyl-CoA dehydratase family protein [Bacillota bacterium]HPZ41109.1 2-hydroxyacyl-CoA dehydratase family protein [Bacillota bacterium]HQD52202.1 2-hydroxyacyl-CoA dehydratase family protein [Bacillota bacterium]